MKTLFFILMISAFAISAPVPKALKKKFLDKCLNECPEAKDGEKEPACVSSCTKDIPCENNCCLYETTSILSDGKEKGDPKTKLLIDGCSADKSSVCYPGPDQEPPAPKPALQGVPMQMPAKIEVLTVKKSYEVTNGPCDSTKISSCNVSYGSDDPTQHEALIDTICANLGITKVDYPVVGMGCEIKCTKGRNFETVELEKLALPFSMCRPWLKDKKPILDSTTFKKLLCGVCKQEGAENVTAKFISCKSWSHEIPDPIRDAVIESFKKNPPSFLPRDFYDEKRH